MNTSISPVKVEPLDKLVTLCDGRCGLRTGLGAEIREPGDRAGDSGAAVLDFIASNDALDRCGEIIDPSGWQLGNYRRNPVFQNAHQYGDILFTLGKALITEVRAGDPGAEREALRGPHLFQRIEFAVEVNPIARVAYGLYRGKFLSAVSVGFIPLRWVNADGSEHAAGQGGPGGRASRSTLPFRRKYVEQELLEVSAVGIPANPEALQLGLKAGAIEKGDLREMLEVLTAVSRAGGQGPAPGTKEEFRSTQMAGAVANPSARGGGVDGAQVLQLARALRELLRRA